MGLFDSFGKSGGADVGFLEIGWKCNTLLAELMRESEDSIPHEEYVKRLEKLASTMAIVTLGSLNALALYELGKGTPTTGNAMKGLKAVAAMQGLLGATETIGLRGAKGPIGLDDTLTREQFLQFIDIMTPIMKEVQSA